MKERALIAAKLRSAIEGSFAHWGAVPDLDFDRTFEDYLDESLAAVSRLDFVLANQRLLASLRNGHTGFSDAWLGASHGRSMGFLARPVAGDWAVVRSSDPRLPVGSVVVSIDDQSMAEVFSLRRAYIDASSHRAAAFRLFFRRHLFRDRMRVRLDTGAEVEVRKSVHPAIPVAPLRIEWTDSLCSASRASKNPNARPKPCT